MRIAFGLLLAAMPMAGVAQSVVSTTPLGEVPATSDSKYFISPDGQHVAVVKSRGSRRLVSIDGKDGELFDSIEYIDRTEGYVSPLDRLMVVFSPDGRRHAYGARRGGEAFVVVDGKTYPEGREFLFSPDSNRFAYVTGKPGQGESIVLDGNVGPQFNAIRQLKFTADSKRFLYVANGDGGWKVVADGKEGPAHEKVVELQVASSGSRYAYLAEVKGDFVPVIDGVVQTGISRGMSYGMPQLRLSADGRRWAFVSMDRTATRYVERVVVDGKPHEGYLRIEDLQFSPDGKRIGYLAAIGDPPRNVRTIFVIDGKRVGLEYRSIHQLQFSPDSRRFAGLAESDAGAFVVVDGEESEAHTHRATDFRFSATGRYAYVARFKAQANKPQPVVDGKPQGEIDELTKNTLTFSPDGTRLVYSATRQFRERLLYFDGKTEPMTIVAGGGPTPWTEHVIFSPNGKHVAFMASGEGQPNLYVDMQPGIAGHVYARPTFSADGLHFAVAGKEPRAKSWTVFMNGKAVGELDEVVPNNAGTWKFADDGKLHILAMQNGQFQRMVVDPQGSSVESFAKNMSKSGKTGEGPGKNAASSGKSVGASVAGGGDPAGASNDGLPDPAAAIDKEVEGVKKKARSALDRLKKLKGVLEESENE